MKTCSKCKILKDSSEFFKCNKSSNGLQSQCKVCKRISVKLAPSSKKTSEYKRSELYKEKRRKYHQKYKLHRNVSRRIRQSLNGIRKSNSWNNLVGYSTHELKVHLEKSFKDGMTWENYGSVWHIDHIIPISSFSITSEQCEEFKKCWSLDNLQPLFALENILKSNKI